MRRFAGCLAGALLALFATFASATPHQHDANDLWVVPDELGWGLNIFHQGDTLFASLFVYGPDGKARWYTGSSLAGNDGGVLHDRPSIYSGPLYESSGPAFNAPFDAARVTRRQVGTMSVELGTETPPGSRPRNYANVTYDIDGVRVQKHAFPFGFVAMGLSGSYRGFQASSNGAIDEMNANVSLNGGSFAMATTNAVGTSCTYSGPQNPNGSLFNVDGGYSCTDGRSGTFAMRDVDVTRHGFTAKFGTAGGSVTDMVTERMSSSIRGDGYSTDLWFPPNESGWGLNIIEQGDTLFGTLFVYDAQGMPRWYSASNLNYETCAPPDSGSDCRGRYTGALAESTGPYFGTSFNPAAVQRRVVGTMSIAFYGDNFAVLEYSVDGATVANKQLTRYAFRANSLAGVYAGHMTSLGNNDRGVHLGAMTIEVVENGNQIVMRMEQGRNCYMRGTRAQYGRQVSASGDYECGLGTIGKLYLMDAYPTWSGFTATFGLDGYPIGRIEGVRVTPH